MKIKHINEREIQVEVEGKGYFEIIIDDWGGKYPGVDVEFHPTDEKETETNPRVLFEYNNEVDCLRTILWLDPDSEDATEIYEVEPR